METVEVPVEWIKGLLERTEAAKSGNEWLIKMTQVYPTMVSNMMLLQGYASSAEAFLKQDQSHDED